MWTQPSTVFWVFALCLQFSPVLASLANGDVSGDAIEHWNIYPLTREITLNTTIPVQAIHIALYGNNKVRVTWLNPTQFHAGNFTFKPRCNYGITAGSLRHLAVGYAYSYEAGMFRLTLNTAILDLNLIPDLYRTVYYMCGDPGYGWSNVFHFNYLHPFIVNPELSVMNMMNGFSEVQFPSNSRSIAKDNIVHMDQAEVTTESAHSPKMIVLIADMGVTHAEDTMAGIQKYVRSNIAQLIFHAGDISYADNFSVKKHNNSYIWVEYMNELAGITPFVPYMTCPGNHEAQFDFAAYVNWLPMPYQASKSSSNFWYSFDYMGVHFLSFSTEHPFDQQSEQFRYIQQDLVTANKNRASVPWVLVFGHRPLYCTSVVSTERCEKEASEYRSYLEDLFYEQEVDVYLCGHNHNYERTFPVYRENATQKDFHNPKAPIYIVDGAAGNPEPNDPTFRHGVDWRAFDYPSVDNGFILAEPTQKQLRFQYVRSKDQKIIDTFTITRS